MPVSRLPEPDTLAEEAVLSCVAHVFLQTPHAARCLAGLGQALDGVILQHLTVFLAFVRAAHLWTKLHPELTFDDDARELLASDAELADCVLNDPEAAMGETALRQSEEFNRSLMNGSADCINDVLDLDGRLLHINPPGLCAMEIDDFSPLCGQAWTHLWPAAARSDIELSVASAVEGRPQSFQAFCPTAKGAPRWWEVTVSPVRDSVNGRVVRLLAVSRDITARKRTEETLQESETRLASELSAMTRLHELVARLFVCTDLHAALEEVLNATLSLVGADRGSVQLFQRETHALEIVAHSGCTPDFLDYFRRVRQGDPTVCARAMEERNRVIVEDVQADPLWEHLRPIAATTGVRAAQSTPLLGQGGQLLGMLSTYSREPHRPSERDLRMIDLYAAQAAGFIQRIRADESIRQYAAELAESDRRKDEFLAVLAHELRNPLAPIRNGLQMMRLARGGDEGTARVRAMMERQIDQMVRLIDDLMDVSRINRGKIELRRETVTLDAVIQSAVDSSRPLIQLMGHQLTVTLPQEPVLLDADLTRLAQVFVNLLNNASKYSDKLGHVRVTATRQGAEVAVRVRDEGIGIAPDELPRVFEMFTQVDTSLEKAHGGLGIGLTLVRRLTEMHGGTVEAHSAGRGTGSEFVVRLPILRKALGPQPGEGEAEPTLKSSLRILIVDDNQDGADCLALTLKLAMGGDTRTAYDGEEALSAERAFRPAVVLLDIGLPKLNGYEVCRRLRQQPGGATSSSSPRPAGARTRTGGAPATRASITTSSSRWTPPR